MRTQSNNNTAIISGASGFIASHLIEALKQRDIEVIELPRNVLYDLSLLMQFLHKNPPTYIFALHGYGNHGHQTDEDNIVMANYFATWNLLKATSFYDYKAFINVATSSMYGKKFEAMKEVDCMFPDTFYAATKLGAMHLARVYSLQYKKPIATVIPFSVFGPGEADFRFIPTMCKNLLDRTTMPFVSSPTHDWIAVQDFIDGLLTVTDNVEKLTGKWVNIGTGQKWTNLEVAESLQAIAGKKLKTKETYKEQPHHSPVWVADNSVLKSLGWEQRYSLEAGLSKTWEYYKLLYTERR